MQDNNRNRCRICLGNQNLADIFAHKIIEKIKYCTTVQVSPEDPFPSKICKICGFYLNVAYVFRMVCEWTDFKLLQELQQTNSITVAINNAQQAQCNEFLCVENEKQSGNKHLIDMLLKQEFLETWQLFGLQNNKIKAHEEETEDYDHNICNTQGLLEKDVDYIHHNLYNNVQNGKSETVFDEKNVPLHQETEQIDVYVNCGQNDVHLHNETISIFVEKPNLMNNTQSTMTKFKDKTSLTNENNSFIDTHNCLITEATLSSDEEDLVVELPLLKNAVLENVINKGRNSASESNTSEDEIINEECLAITVKEKSNLNIEAHKENEPITKYPLVDNCINNQHVHFLNEKSAIEQEILDDVLVDDAIYECETHQDIYHKSIYGEVCLNAEDPLLHNITSQENEEIDLSNIEANLKSCICVQNKPENLEKPPNDKQITLNSISLHDFENFEKEQLNNAFSDNIPNQNDHTDSDKDKLNNKTVSKNVATGHSENRVGRHIAKKNAGQPPKRYSPTPESAKIASATQKPTMVKDDTTEEPKCTKIDETEFKLDKKTKSREINSILDQEYILESDMSMPEPIFEETIVTDGYYFEDNDEEVTESNLVAPGSKINAKIKSQVKRNQKSSKKGSNCTKKKINVFIDQTAVKSIRPRRNKYSIKEYANFHQNSNAVEISDDNDDDYHSETEIKSNGSQLCSSDDEDDNYKNDQQLCNSKKPKFSNKKSKKLKNSGTTCKLCNKSFPFPSHLQRHLTAHIGIKRFICKYCNKEFLHRYNLSVHLRSHTGNFPLQCNICNRGFVSSSVLERHKRSHTGETPFQCRYCLQLFSHASSLNMHEKMHLNRPSFPCDVCYKVFSYKSSLNAHKKGHSGFKPHSCSVCHKMFTRRTSVLRHMSCHAEVKKFKCRNCGELLGSQGSLVKHRKIHQGLCH